MMTLTKHSVLVGVFLGLCSLGSAAGPYKPTWESLDTRPAPQWYDQAKIGIFLHWGVFSVPSFSSEWFWQQWVSGNILDRPKVRGLSGTVEVNRTLFNLKEAVTTVKAQDSNPKAQNFESYELRLLVFAESLHEVVDFMMKNYPPGWTYADFAPQFRAELFNATQWATLFANAGAKYVVLTTKHHEGFTLWPSSTAFNWNAKDVGPGKDLVGELSTAVRAAGVHFGVYHSMMDWYHPLYLRDKQNQWKTQDFVEAKCTNELHELVNNYKPDILWSDGEWEAPDVYWNSTNFLAWLYNDSPVRDKILVNDRWGSGVRCKHGDFYNCDDKYNPGTLQPHKWENCMTMDRNSWGYRRNMNLDDVLSVDDLLESLAQTISCNGNILINVGPRAAGTLDAIFEERLLQLGAWLKLNGAAIYGSRPWTTQHDSVDKRVWYTTDGDSVYAIVTRYESEDRIRLGALNANSLSSDSTFTVLGYERPLKFTTDNLGVTIYAPTPGAPFDVQYAPVIKISVGKSP